MSQPFRFSFVQRYFFKVQVVPKPLACHRGKSLLVECHPLDDQIVRALLLPTFMFMTAWAFEARHCPTLPNEIKKTKLQIYTEPQAGINILLCTCAASQTLSSLKGLKF